MAQVRSRSELYEIYKAEAQAIDPTLTDFSEGSINDVIAGSTSTALSELVGLITDEFRQTFFATSNGPEITGGDDELERLAVDHFGASFARPAAQQAVGVVTFSRPNVDEGDVIIPAGTVVATATDANGQNIRFETELEVEILTTSINASVVAIEAGTAGNVGIGKVVDIESTLTDPTITVSNAAEFSGGAAAEDDSQYRQTIINLIQQIKGATASAVKSKLLNISGIEQATVIEFLQTVTEFDENTQSVVGLPFKIPRARAYIADANGTASAPLVAKAEEAVAEVRAAGVRVEVIAAVAVPLNWTAQLDLNPAGPNYATLQTDTSLISDSMRKYLQDLDIGSDFTRALANKAILDLWGPNGTGDLVAQGFSTVSPSGDVVSSQNERIIPNTVEIS